MLHLTAELYCYSMLYYTILQAAVDTEEVFDTVVRLKAHPSFCMR